MSAKKPKRAGDGEVRISPPELRHFRFEKHDVASGEVPNAAPPVVFGLGLNRISESTLGVELSLEIREFAVCSVFVSYRAVFELVGPLTRAERKERLQVLATQLGPGTLYPFLREVVVSAAAKALLPPLVPPVVLFKEVFAAEQVQIPEPPEPASVREHA